jgi:hypothetical protein
MNRLRTLQIRFAALLTVLLMAPLTAKADIAFPDDLETEGPSTAWVAVAGGLIAAGIGVGAYIATRKNKP